MQTSTWPLDIVAYFTQMSRAWSQYEVTSVITYHQDVSRSNRYLPVVEKGGFSTFYVKASAGKGFISTLSYRSDTSACFFLISAVEPSYNDGGLVTKTKRISFPPDFRDGGEDQKRCQSGFLVPERL